MDPSSAVFLSSSRDHPVHLWDAYSGTVRCAYQTYDHLDQIMGPNSLCFTPDGSKIYCGFENCVQVFETSRPGNEGWKFSTTPTRKAKEGQKGIISTIAFCPDRSGLWAAGSYGRTIGLYDERQDGALYILSDGDVDDDQIRRATVPGRTPSPNRRTMGGVTQVTFSPDGMYLYSASRKDNLILCWDIRNSDAVLCAFDRGPSDTNQRMSFDVDGAGKWLVAGDTEGVVSVFGLDGPRTAVADTEIGYDGNVGLDGGKNRIQKTWSVHQGGSPRQSHP